MSYAVRFSTTDGREVWGYAADAMHPFHIGEKIIISTTCDSGLGAAGQTTSKMVKKYLILDIQVIRHRIFSEEMEFSGLIESSNKVNITVKEITDE